jgi:hypothetical protein
MGLLTNLTIIGVVILLLCLTVIGVGLYDYYLFVTGNSLLTPNPVFDYICMALTPILLYNLAT